MWIGIENVFKQSPTTTALIKAGKLEVVRAIHDLDTGIVEWKGTHPEQNELLKKYGKADPAKR